MEKPQSSSTTVSTSQELHCSTNVLKCDADSDIAHLPHYIPDTVLGDSIVWLDIFSNERDLTFARQMITDNRLIIFDTAVDCIDFVELFLVRQSTLSIIISGAYAINMKVINQLLKHNYINKIYLISNQNLNEKHFHPLLSNQYINIIYNKDPDLVMRRLCDEYSHFDSFTQHNNQSHASATTDTCQLDIEDESSISHAIENKNLQCDVSTAVNINRKDLSTNNEPSFRRSPAFWTTDEARIVQADELDSETDDDALSVHDSDQQSNITSLLSTNSLSSLDAQPSDHAQRAKSIDDQLSFSQCDSKDVLAMEELNQIEQNLAFMNLRVNDLEQGDLTLNDRLYIMLDEQALQLIVRCDQLTDISSEVIAVREQIIQNIRHVLSKLESKISTNGQQLHENRYSVAV